MAQLRSAPTLAVYRLKVAGLVPVAPADARPVRGVDRRLAGHAAEVARHLGRSPVDAIAGLGAILGMLPGRPDDLELVGEGQYAFVVGWGDGRVARVVRVGPGRRNTVSVGAARRSALVDGALAADDRLAGLVLAGKHYLIKDGIRGLHVTLVRRLPAEATVSDEDRAQTMVGTLRRLHAAGVAHLDFRRGNVWVGESGPVVLDTDRCVWKGDLSDDRWQLARHLDLAILQDELRVLVGAPRALELLQAAGVDLGDLASFRSRHPDLARVYYDNFVHVASERSSERRPGSEVMPLAQLRSATAQAEESVESKGSDESDESDEFPEPVPVVRRSSDPPTTPALRARREPPDNHPAPAAGPRLGPTGTVLDTPAPARRTDTVLATPTPARGAGRTDTVLATPTPAHGFGRTDTVLDTPASALQPGTHARRAGQIPTRLSFGRS